MVFIHIVRVTKAVARCFMLARAGALGLPLVLRALHKYHVKQTTREAVSHNVEERNAHDAAERLVVMLCERLCNTWGSAAVRTAVTNIRCAS